MFAATTAEDGSHRISVRRIRTILTVHDYSGKKLDVQFKSRAVAKECADLLNETEYDNFFDKKTGLVLDGVDRAKANSVHVQVFEIIRKMMV